MPTVAEGVLRPKPRLAARSYRARHFIRPDEGQRYILSSFREVDRRQVGESHNAVAILFEELAEARSLAEARDQVDVAVISRDPPSVEVECPATTQPKADAGTAKELGQLEEGRVEFGCSCPSPTCHFPGKVANCRQSGFRPWRAGCLLRRPVEHTLVRLPGLSTWQTPEGVVEALAACPRRSNRHLS